MVRDACGIFVSKKFHVAAERNCRNLPTRTVAIIESDDLGSETDRKCQDLDAAPTRHQKMAKLMKENNDRQHKQKRHDIADEAAAERAQASDDFHTHSYPRLSLAGLRATRDLPRMPLRQFRARGPGLAFFQ